MLWVLQARTVEDIIRGSPEWKPQATLAISIKGRSSSSGPFVDGIRQLMAVLRIEERLAVRAYTFKVAVTFAEINVDESFMFDGRHVRCSVGPLNRDLDGKDNQA